MREFQLSILSPEKKIYNGKAVYCAISTFDGDMGIEAYHEPFMATLKKGSVLRYKTNSGDETSVDVSNSIVSFENNVCTVLMG